MNSGTGPESAGARRAPAPFYRWTVLGIVMTGTFMAILDTSIVNVALPYMMSGFGVTRDQIEWVATAFMLASASVMPLMGWLSGRFGYKPLYLVCLLIFTIGSGLCAVAWSYDVLIAARVVQALGGGAIQPVGLIIVADLFEPHERGRALGIWGTGAMVAPAVGPVLGGYLTDHFTWRSIFSVNLPIGAVALIAGLMIMRRGGAAGRRTPLDVWGYAFLAMALVAGLLAVSEGQQKGWSSTYIRTAEAIAAVGLVMFLGIESGVKHPILDLGLFRARNFTLSLVLAVFRSIGLFGSVFLLPLFLVNLMGYTTTDAGLWMMPGAVAVGATMPVAGRLADRYGPAWLVASGSLLVGVSLIAFGHLDPLSGWRTIVLPQVARGVGLALMMAPLLAAALNSVPRERTPMASSFLNVVQFSAGAFGIALLNNVVTDAVHRHAVRAGALTPLQSETFARLADKAAHVVVRHSPGKELTAYGKAEFLLARTVDGRATALGFENGFVFAGILLLCAVPLCFLLKKAPHHRR